MKRIGPIKSPLRGEIAVPGDKSIAHRAVILGSIAEGRSRIFNLSGGDDNSRTVRAFRQMGVEASVNYRVTPQFTLDANVGYNDTHYTSFTNQSCWNGTLARDSRAAVPGHRGPAPR